MKVDQVVKVSQLGENETNCENDSHSSSSK